MRRFALVALLFSVAAACSSFGSDTHPESPVDGGAPPADGSPSDAGVSDGDGDADAGPTAPFCATNDASLCEDFDSVDPLSLWIDASTEGTATLTNSSAPASAPKALQLTSPSTLTPGKCDDRAGIKRPIPTTTVTTITFEAKYRTYAIDALVGANGGPSIELVAADAPPASCTFYLGWNAGRPAVLVDQKFVDAGESDSFASVDMSPKALSPKDWHRIVVTLAPSTAGTVISGAVDSVAFGPATIATCKGRELDYVEIGSGCLNTASRPFQIDVDDLLVDW
jgi:hypothetical protein